MARLLQLFLFACVLATAMALGSAAESTAPSGTINLAQSNAPATPAKPFFDPLLMYNPYMWMYWNPMMWLYWNPMMWMYYPYMMWW